MRSILLPLRPASLALAATLGLLYACGDGGGGDDAGGICEALSEPPSALGSPVALRVINDGAEAVFLREVYGCTQRWFELSQGDARLDEGPAGCDTCEATLAGDGCGRCTQAACLGLNFIRIEPGVTFTIEWPGVVYDTVEWPGACSWDEDRCLAAPTSCVAPRAAPAGTYSVRLVQAFGVSGCQGGPCECAPGDSFCMLSSDQYMTFLDVVAPLELPGTDVIDFHLQ